MTIASTYEVALALVVTGLAVWIVSARETFAAAESFVAYGLLLPLIWVRLGSVDVALAEAAIGGGLGGVLLLGAAARLGTTEVAAAAECPSGILHLGAAMLAAIVACSLAVVVLDPAGPRAHARSGSRREFSCDRPRQSGYERFDGLSRHGHPAREGRALNSSDRYLVFGARPILGRAPGAASRGGSARRACFPCATTAPAWNCH